MSLCGGFRLLFGGQPENGKWSVGNELPTLRALVFRQPEMWGVPVQ
ncbi:hypothetical protein [Kingella sp. (in: b-proteobacteria)]|nr:hypothetical protein [Kingella sp. (in: b-proteobacteria)]MDO4658227.1 hypothetical protein [Kingella sp. (in: b-proteobacteria)]